MRQIRTSLLALIACAALWPWSAASAQWELVNGRSSVNFISIKNDIVAETHSFTSMVGFIGADGNAQLVIDLDSVETMIPIRNERMREMLFETAKFPAAKISAQVEPGLLDEMADGGIITLDLPLRIELHGQSKTVTAPVAVVAEPGGNLHLYSTRPIVVNASDFGLEAGVVALRDIAGLKGISNAVPITVELVFAPAA